jgi:hypothetical protein
MQEIAVQQPFGQVVTIVGRAHRAPETLEPFTLGGRDLRVDRIETRQSGQQILPWGAFTAGILAARSFRTAGRIVTGQRVEPSRQVTHL